MTFVLLELPNVGISIGIDHHTLTMRLALAVDLPTVTVSFLGNKLELIPVKFATLELAVLQLTFSVARPGEYQFPDTSGFRVFRVS